MLGLERAVADMGALREIGAEVRDILCFHLGVEVARLTDGTRLHEDLGADSLDVVEIVMSCEERFGVEIPNRAATALTTVGDAIRCVQAEVAAAGQRRGKQPLQAALP